MSATVAPSPLDELQVALGDRSYPVRFVAGLPGPALARAARERIPGARRALVVTDSNVGPLYAAGVVTALGGAGLEVTLHEVAAGEASKRLDTVAAVLDHALSASLLRGDLLVALGGGVVGDIAGFAASILHRGVALLQAPTSLLAQVDSAVGGKTGVNHALGKNLIGSFWQPRAVIASLAALSTLPPRQVRCGLAEALKHGYLADAALVARASAQVRDLLAVEPAATSTLVAACCRIKAAVVAADERDHGRRALLNLGHTFGHAYERLVGYGVLTHGEAVALGMLWAARLSARLGLADVGLEGAMAATLASFGLPHAVAAPDLPDLDALIAAARGDKKADADGVRFVLLRGIGQALVRRLSWDEVRARLSRGVPEA